MKEKENEQITAFVIGILGVAPNDATPAILLTGLVEALGIVIAGTAKDVYDEKMYEPLVDFIKEKAQREESAQIFKRIYN